jgi:hypothetical protein
MHTCGEGCPIILRSCENPENERGSLHAGNSLIVRPPPDAPVGRVARRAVVEENPRWLPTSSSYAAHFRNRYWPAPGPGSHPTMTPQRSPRTPEVKLRAKGTRAVSPAALTWLCALAEAGRRKISAFDCALPKAATPRTRLTRRTAVATERVSMLGVRRGQI